MASDSLRQVGRDLKKMNRRSEFAVKRVQNQIPKKERARDTMSSLFPFTMRLDSAGDRSTYTMSINFNKPPPSECSAECIATACESFTVAAGTYTLGTTNPYEPETVRVYNGGGEPTPNPNFLEENPSAGQVRVVSPAETDLIIICYSYIIC